MWSLYIMEWFRQVYRWRTGASIIWSLLLAIPPIIVLKVIFSLLSESWNWWSIGYGLLFIFSMIVIQLLYSVTASANFIIYKTRLQKIWNCICPTHLFIHSIFVVMAMTSGVSLLKLAGYTVSNGQTVLNTSFLMTILYCGYLGLVFSFNYFRNRDYILVFPVIQQKKIFRLKGHFRSSVKATALHCIKCIPSFMLFYCLFGYRFKRIFEITFTLKPSGHSFWCLLCDLFNIHYLFPMVVMGMFLHLSWTWSLKMFRVYQTQAIQFPVLPVFSSESQNDILSALGSSDNLLKYLGFLDLYQLAEASPVRRKQVFSLNQSGLPAVWPDIQKHCLNLIENTIDDLGGNIFDNTSNTSDDALFPTTDETKKVQYSKGWSPQINGPSVLRRRDVVDVRARLWSQGSVIEAKVRKGGNTQQIEKDEEVNIIEMVKDFKESVIEKLKKRRAISYFINELPIVAETKGFTDSQLVVWSISALSLLIVASYTEDTYGVVQQNLQLSVTRMIYLLQLLDKKVVHLLSKTHPTNKIKTIELNGKYAIKSAVVTGLQLILQTFKDIRFLHLSQEQLKICRKLQLI